MGMIIGVCFAQIYHIETDEGDNCNSTERKYNGYWISERNETEAKEFVENKDEYGDWVCVNIKNMSYETMESTCRHEVGHEMFAEHCEDNITKCMKAVEK